jgi:hypothetical protein
MRLPQGTGLRECKVDKRVREKSKREEEVTSIEHLVYQTFCWALYTCHLRDAQNNPKRQDGSGSHL